jgi:hypothetical protein
VGFVVDKVALELVFSEYFGFPCQSSFHRLLHIHHHLSSRTGTIGQLVTDVRSGLSLIPPRIIKKNKKSEGQKLENPCHEEPNLAESSKEGYSPKRAVLPPPTTTMMDDDDDDDKNARIM